MRFPNVAIAVRFIFDVFVLGMLANIFYNTIALFIYYYSSHGTVGIWLDWLEITKPIVRSVTEALPHLDGIHRKISAMGYESRADLARHLYAMNWFIPLLFAPLCVGPSCRFVWFFLRRPDLFRMQRLQVRLRPFGENRVVDGKRPGRMKTRLVNLALGITLLLAIFLLGYSIGAISNISDSGWRPSRPHVQDSSLYRIALTIPAMYACFIVSLGVLIVRLRIWNEPWAR